MIAFRGQKRLGHGQIGLVYFRRTSPPLSFGSLPRGCLLKHAESSSLKKKTDPKNGPQVWRQILKNGLQQSKTEQKNAIVYKNALRLVHEKSDYMHMVNCDNNNNRITSLIVCTSVIFSRLNLEAIERTWKTRKTNLANKTIKSNPSESLSRWHFNIT